MQQGCEDIEANLEYMLGEKANLKLEVEELKYGINELERREPGFWSWLFGTERYVEWKYQKTQSAQKLRILDAKLDKLDMEIPQAKRMLQDMSLEVKEGSVRLDRVRADISEIEKYRREFGSSLIDVGFAELPHAKKQEISPWVDEITQQIRENVFIEAMNLHKAFIDAVAKPIKQNIGALMHNWENKEASEARELITDLWSSLFLVVPCISTTFSSVERMLADLPESSLGWV